MIPWYKKFYQVGEGEFESELETEYIIKRLKDKFGTPEEQKANYSALRGHAAFAIDFFWANHFTIKRIAISSDVGTRPMSPGTQINGQIIEYDELRTIHFVASIRLGWFLVFILVGLLSSAWGVAGFALGFLTCSGTYLILRTMAIADLQNIDIEIYKSLKAK